MRPLIWQLRAGAARALTALGRDNEAQVKWDEARGMIEEIAAIFEDDEMRVMYVASASAKISRGCGSISERAKINFSRPLSICHGFALSRVIVVRRAMRAEYLR